MLEGKIPELKLLSFEFNKLASQFRKTLPSRSAELSRVAHPQVMVEISFIAPHPISRPERQTEICPTFVGGKVPSGLNNQAMKLPVEKPLTGM
jgi:hypothetical protein